MVAEKLPSLGIGGLKVQVEATPMTGGFDGDAWGWSARESDPLGARALPWRPVAGAVGLLVAALRSLKMSWPSCAAVVGPWPFVSLTPLSATLGPPADPFVPFWVVIESLKLS